MIADVRNAVKRYGPPTR